MPTFLGGRASVTKRSFPVLPKTADVIVIGAGAGGAAAAWALARKDVKVILIDAGPSYNTSEYKVADDDWELGGFLGKPGYQGQYEIKVRDNSNVDKVWILCRFWCNFKSILEPKWIKFVTFGVSSVNPEDIFNS